ncbi:MAG TPA: DedA family protein [Thermoplasmata archaeon]|nr:DedA family protein [Thermoplasmata archaeon]
MVAIPIIETVVGAIMTVMVTIGLAGLLALMAVESFGIPPLPSEIILPFAGFLIFQGTYSWPLAFLAALAGGVVGSYIAYAIGRWGRRYLVQGPKFLRLNPAHLAAMDSFFVRHGEGTVLLSRMVPVIRSYISYPAGAAKMEPVRFGLYTAVGATPFTLALMYAGYLLGHSWADIVPYFQKADYAAVAVIVLAIAYVALRWRGVITPGWPPRRAHRAAGGPTPPSTGPTEEPGAETTP